MSEKDEPMSDLSLRHSLPFIATGQSQKEITHNDAVARIDTLLHLAVRSMLESTPPADPAVGEAWIVGPEATGMWSGHDAEIAAYCAGGWRFAVPVAGCLAWVADLGVFAVRTGSVWLSDAWPARRLRIGESDLLGSTQSPIAAATGGAIVDIEARATIVEILTVLRFMGFIAA
jgi:Protein of unknown function (DUF2793)